MTIHEDIKNLVDEGTREYFAWMRHILTLSSGSLTLLVAFQSKLLPDQPHMLFLLKLSWLLFALSVILALFGLAGYHKLYFRTATEIYHQVKTQAIWKGVRTPIPEPYRLCGKILPWVFVAAIVCLALFGIMNLNLQSKASADNGNKQATTSAPYNQ